MRVKCPKCKKRFETNPKAPRIPENQVRKLRDKGMKMEDIARQLGCSIAGVSRLLAKIQAREPDWQQPVLQAGRKRIDDAEVKRLRLTACLTVREIAESMDVHPHTIHNSLRRQGLQGYYKGRLRQDCAPTGMGTGLAGHIEENADAMAE